MSETNGKEVAVTEPKTPALPAAKAFSFMPTSVKEAIDLAKMIADSDLAPKDFRGKPGNCLIAIVMGEEVGLAPMQAIQNIAVINGKPGVYGDVGKALLFSHGFKIDERDIKEVQAKGEAWCKVTRPDGTFAERTYSLENAKTAKLWGKEGPWTTNPYLQMAWRAFWFAARDKAADVLKGLAGAEELRDYVDTTATEVPQVITPKPLESPKTAPADDAPPENINAILNPAQLAFIGRKLGEWGAGTEEVTRFISDKFGKKTLAELTVDESRKVLKAWANEPPVGAESEPK